MNFGEAYKGKTVFVTGHDAQLPHRVVIREITCRNEERWCPGARRREGCCTRASRSCDW